MKHTVLHGCWLMDEKFMLGGVKKVLHHASLYAILSLACCGT
jgi:hypothetical protein